ncbi:MAG TPA: aminotransferase class I/II-fold pyridoxal phosphate-dependent enzyme [Acidimicrobiales bacterium]|nr:aminotransferase class I/II-fold pyridoxal phosphate-dependent enzyme [Acidimicrobiales bacterium]
MDSLLGTCSLESLRLRKSWKWTAFPDDVLPAWVAEMDFDIAEPIQAAVRDALELGDCGYPSRIGFGEAYADFAEKRFGWAPDAARVFPIPDVMTGIAEVIQATTSPGAGIVINPPVYPPFFFRVALAGRRVVEAPLARDTEGRYDLDLEALDEAFASDGVAAYIFCNPHNPTGRVWSLEQLLAVASLCDSRGVALLVDEIHAPLVLRGARHIPFLSLDHDVTSRVHTFTSATKGWNISGLKCGVAVTGSSELDSVLSERWEALLAGHLGVLASIAAFIESVTWLDAVVDQLDQNRHLLSDLLERELPEVTYVPPEASFLAWLDCRRLGLGDDPSVRFLQKGRIALSPGPDFGTQGKGFARLNMGTSPELLEQIVRRMAVSLDH